MTFNYILAHPQKYKWHHLKLLYYIISLKYNGYARLGARISRIFANAIGEKK